MFVPPGSTVLVTGSAGFRGTGLSQVSRPWSFSIWLRFDVRHCASIRRKSRGVSPKDGIFDYLLKNIDAADTDPNLSLDSCGGGFAATRYTVPSGPTGHQVFKEED